MLNMLVNNILLYDNSVYALVQRPIQNATRRRLVRDDRLNRECDPMFILAPGSCLTPNIASSDRLARCSFCDFGVFRYTRNGNFLKWHVARRHYCPRFGTREIIY